jgi:hypothetical protein
MSDLIIANTIRQQLGGHKFAVMCGVKQFVGGENFLQFKMPSNFAKDKINLVKIILTPADLYDIEFYYTRGVNLKMVCKVEGIYCDMLQSEFTRVTGLDTHL